MKSASVAALRVKCRFTVYSDRQVMLKISFYGFTAVHVGLTGAEYHPVLQLISPSTSS